MNNAKKKKRRSPKRQDEGGLPFVQVPTDDPRGVVVAAERSFTKGQVIFKERPVLKMPADDIPGSVKGFLQMDYKAKDTIFDMYCPPLSQVRNPELLELLEPDGVAELVRDARINARPEDMEDLMEEVSRFLRIVDSNAQTFSSKALGGDEDSAQWWTFLFYASRMNHSCIPNAYLYDMLDYSGEIWWIATTDIEEGEELNTSYLADVDGNGPWPMLPSLLLPAERRQAKLFKDWGFRCLCPRCRDPLAADPSRTLRCPNCGKGEVAIRRWPDQDDDARRESHYLTACAACEHTASAKEVEKLLRVEEQATLGARATWTPIGCMMRKRGFGAHAPRSRLGDWAGRLVRAGLGTTHWLLQWMECLAGFGPPMSQLARPPWRSLPSALKDYFEVVGKAESGMLAGVEDNGRRETAREARRAAAEAARLQQDRIQKRRARRLAEMAQSAAPPDPEPERPPPEPEFEQLPPEPEQLMPLDAGDLQAVLPKLKYFFKRHKDDLGDEGVAYYREMFKVFARDPGPSFAFLRRIYDLPTPEARQEFWRLLEETNQISARKAQALSEPQAAG